MPDDPSIPPHTAPSVVERLARVRRRGRDLRFTINERDRIGYELKVRFIDDRGEPVVERLTFGRDRQALEEIRRALERQQQDPSRSSGTQTKGANRSRLARL